MPQQLKAKHFDVELGHMLCRQCITAYENIVNASSSDTEVEETPMDDTDVDALDGAAYKMYETPRKRLNKSLETVGVSPVNLHGALQHSRATSAKQKLDKVVDKYTSTIAEAYNVSKDVLDTSDSVFEQSDEWKAAELERLHNVMREKLKTASYPEKIEILTLIPDKWSRDYASKQFDVGEYLIRTAHESKKVGGILAKHAPKKVKDFQKILSIKSKVSMKMMSTVGRCLERRTM